MPWKGSSYSDTCLLKQVNENILVSASGDGSIKATLDLFHVLHVQFTETHLFWSLFRKRACRGCKHIRYGFSFTEDDFKQDPLLRFNFEFCAYFLQIWDLTAPPMANPVRSHQEHAHEVYVSSLYC